MVVTGVTVKVITPDGEEFYIYPTRIDVKINENAATEVSITLDNTDGRNTNILRYGYIIEIESSL